MALFSTNLNNSNDNVDCTMNSQMNVSVAFLLFCSSTLTFIFNFRIAQVLVAVLDKWANLLKTYILPHLKKKLKDL